MLISVQNRQTPSITIKIILWDYSFQFVLFVSLVVLWLDFGRASVPASRAVRPSPHTHCPAPGWCPARTFAGFFPVKRTYPQISAHSEVRNSDTQAPGWCAGSDLVRPASPVAWCKPFHPAPGASRPCRVPHAGRIAPFISPSKRSVPMSKNTLQSLFPLRPASPANSDNRNPFPSPAS